MMKRGFALLLTLLCALSLLAGCGGKSTEQTAEEKPAVGETQETPEAPENADTWHELDESTGILTVRIPAEKSGYTWNFTIDDESVLELLTCE